jgi:transcriptional regulator with XRE-family HTH domain
MAYKIDFSMASSEQIEAALCERLAHIRLTKNLTQAQLAKEAGIALKTIGRMEQGLGISLDTFIRVLAALGIEDHLNALLPDPTIRPVERVQTGGVERKRARPKQTADENKPWAWGDETEKQR